MPKGAMKGGYKSKGKGMSYKGKDPKSVVRKGEYKKPMKRGKKK